MMEMKLPAQRRRVNQTEMATDGTLCQMELLASHRMAACSADLDPKGRMPCNLVGLLRCQGSFTVFRKSGTPFQNSFIFGYLKDKRC